MKASLTREAAKKAAAAGVTVAQQNVESKQDHKEVPLTQEGVRELQNEARIDRLRAAVAGGAAGTLAATAIILPIALTVGPASHGGSAALVVTGLLSGAVAGAVIGAKADLRFEAHPDKMRTFGLFYTGVATSKEQSKAIVSFLRQNGYLSRLRGDFKRDRDLSGLAEALRNSHLDLTQEQAMGVVDYLKFAKTI